MTPTPAGPAGLVWINGPKMTPCRRCKRDMFVVDNWDELTEEQKADAICSDCYRTLMFNTSLG